MLPSANNNQPVQVNKNMLPSGNWPL